jgi:hypothetical protein
VDTAANIVAQIGALKNDAGNINAVTSTSGVAAVNVATFVADQTILNKFAGGFAVVDTAANIVAQIGALKNDAGNINAVTSTSGVAAVNVATFVADQTILDKFAGGFAVKDTGANVLAQIGALKNDAGHIGAVTSTSGVVAVNAATFLADQTILDKFVGGFAVGDTGANVLAQIGALEKDAGAIASVKLSDSTAGSPDVLTLSASNAANDADALAKITSPYILDAIGTSGTAVTGHGSGITINIGAGSQQNLTVTGGGATETFLFAANFGTVEITDCGKYASTATPDLIYLSNKDFANWSTLLADGRQDGANTMFSAADGASLTLDGVSLTSLQTASAALKAEFRFHA